MDRMLASPVRRGAMMAGTMAYQALTTVVQTLIVFAIAFVAGARFPGGAGRDLDHGLAAVLISTIIAAFSCAVALLVRQQEALIGISQFIVLPLQFLSAAVMDTALSPAWVQAVARYNPVNWAVVASREALGRRHRLGHGLAAARCPARAVVAPVVAGDPGVPGLPALGVAAAGWVSGRDGLGAEQRLEVTHQGGGRGDPVPVAQAQQVLAVAADQPQVHLGRARVGGQHVLEPVDQRRVHRAGAIFTTTGPRGPSVMSSTVTSEAMILTVSSRVSVRAAHRDDGVLGDRSAPPAA